MKYVVRVGAVGWIDSAGPWPIKPGMFQMARQAYDGMQIQPSWIVKTYMGLIATSNNRPNQNPLNFKQYRRGRDFRAMIWARLTFDDGPAGATGPVGATLYNAESLIIDPGCTPPVDFTKVPAMLPVAYKKSVRDRASYPGELSPVTELCTAERHPNSVLGATAPNEKLIANGLIRFRAGPHTDKVGEDDAGSEYHVPWVWAEFLLTSLGDGNVRLRGACSSFPDVAWYLNDVQQSPINQQPTDAIFPVSKTNAIFDTINVHALKIWPVLSAGAPMSMGEPPPSFDLPYKGKQVPVTSMKWTCPGGQVVDVMGRAEAQPGV